MVAPTMLRVVLDTNVLVRAVVNVRSASGRILVACQSRQMVSLLNTQVMREYRAMLSHPELLRRYPELQSAKIKIALERLAYVGEKISPARRIEFRRDPRDAKFLELAIAGQASHLVTSDPDLLDLRKSHDTAAKQFRRLAPATEIMGPEEFLRRY